MMKVSAIALAMTSSAVPAAAQSSLAMTGAAPVAVQRCAILAPTWRCFRHHAEMKRTASDIPGGIRAVTESEDPRVASLIQEHVSAMYAHLDREQPFPYPMSRSVPKMFANSSRYHRRLTILPKGIAVTETSNDPEMIQVIRLHAREINGFVNDGMPAMMRGMM